MSTVFSRRVPYLPLSHSWTDNGEHKRHNTYPLAHSSRKKDRRWPLVLRFWKGSIHSTIAFPVFVHAVIAAAVVYVNQHVPNHDFNLPSSIIPSLSIVVGLMLVFRNQTAFSRFWNGRLHVNTVTTAIRCIARQILVLVPAPAVPFDLQSSEPYLDAPGTGTRTPMSYYEALPTANDDVVLLSRPDELRTIETVHILIAMLYTIKNHLRAEWGVALSPGTRLTEDGQEDIVDEYKDLLPPQLKGYEHRGLGLTLQLSTFVEDFVNLGVQRSWFHNAAASALLSSLNSLTSAYGSMEVIRLVPIPVAHLIHHKQTLALFCGILPFAMASEMSWWAVPLVAFVAFTLYGIEGIAQTYEDPFGVAKIDINLDDIVEDTRREVEVLLSAWQIQGGRGGIFRPHVPGDGLMSDASSAYFGPPSVPDLGPQTTSTRAAGADATAENEDSILRVVVNDLSRSILRDTTAEQARIREREQRSATRPSLSRGPSFGTGTGAGLVTPPPGRRDASSTGPGGGGGAAGSAGGGVNVPGTMYMASASQARQDAARGGVAGTPGGKKLSWHDAGSAA